MRKSLLLVIHAVTFVTFSFAVYYDFYYTVVPGDVTKMHKAYGGKFKFLTFWDAIIQAIFFLICVVNDLYGTNKVAPKSVPLIRKIKDYFHATYGFPLAMFVGVTFWSLMFVDRELVLPKALDPYFPWWLNHLMHTLIMVSTVLEMIVAPRKYPKRSHGFTGLMVLMLVYLVWVHIIYMKSGIWVYPVMEVLTLPLRILFFLVLLGFSSMLYFAGEAFNQLIWGSNTAKKPSGKASKKTKSK
ncbi:androgen-induced gene 1 protein-like isoform X2 [Venturia canescens]|uniref:androgen-induced gene 1 protein-like isoform X2 n=1 Tax=Venturia canescens TaxID=32260 RepID=UPI001C9CDAC0|nr:androgen-induced gene 1 protein-like isoform X2 [Venturia canescens]XP_043274501.1 androgen-induced gene 1 protein-like isoform X2 [Venturia canescens]